MPTFPASSVNGAVVDEINTHLLDLARYEVGTAQRIANELMILRDNLVKQIAQLDPTAPPSVRQARLLALFKQTDATIKKYYGQAADLLDGELVDLVATESRFVRTMFNDVMQASVATVAVTPAMARQVAKQTLVAGGPIMEWMEKQSDDFRNLFTREMRQGFLAGETVDQLTRRLRGTSTGRWTKYTTKAGKVHHLHEFQGGIMDTTTAKARALARTAINSVANETRMMSYQDNIDLIESFMAHVTLDTRTSEICMARSGYRWDAQTYEPIAPNTEPYPGPPAWHFNCRSTLLPVLKSWDQLGAEAPSLKGKRIPATTRQSMDGQVPASLNYEMWLREKDKVAPLAVREHLGAGVYELWKEGTITVHDLLKNGKVLTLAELKKTVGLKMVKEKMTTLAGELTLSMAGPAAKAQVMEQLVDEATSMGVLDELQASMATVQSAIAEEVTKATHIKAAKISQYKKAYMAGKTPSPAAQAAWDVLDEAEKSAYLNKWGAPQAAKELADAAAANDTLLGLLKQDGIKVGDLPTSEGLSLAQLRAQIQQARTRMVDTVTEELKALDTLAANPVLQKPGNMIPVAAKQLKEEVAPFLKLADDADAQQITDSVMALSKARQQIKQVTETAQTAITNLGTSAATIKAVQVELDELADFQKYYANQVDDGLQALVDNAALNAAAADPQATAAALTTVRGVYITQTANTIGKPLADDAAAVLSRMQVGGNILSRDAVSTFKLGEGKLDNMLEEVLQAKQSLASADIEEVYGALKTLARITKALDADMSKQAIRNRLLYTRAHKIIDTGTPFTLEPALMNQIASFPPSLRETQFVRMAQWKQLRMQMADDNVLDLRRMAEALDPQVDELLDAFKMLNHPELRPLLDLNKNYLENHIALLKGLDEPLLKESSFDLLQKYLYRADLARSSLKDFPGGLDNLANIIRKRILPAQPFGSAKMIKDFKLATPDDVQELGWLLSQGTKLDTATIHKMAKVAVDVAVSLNVSLIGIPSGTGLVNYLVKRTNDLAELLEELMALPNGAAYATKATGTDAIKLLIRGLKTEAKMESVSGMSAVLKNYGLTLGAADDFAKSIAGVADDMLKLVKGSGASTMYQTAAEDAAQWFKDNLDFALPMKLKPATAHLKTISNALDAAQAAPATATAVKAAIDPDAQLIKFGFGDMPKTVKPTEVAKISDTLTEIQDTMSDLLTSAVTFSKHSALHDELVEVAEDLHKRILTGKGYQDAKFFKWYTSAKRRQLHASILEMTEDTVKQFGPGLDMGATLAHFKDMVNQHGYWKAFNKLDDILGATSAGKKPPAFLAKKGPQTPPQAASGAISPQTGTPVPPPTPSAPPTAAPTAGTSAKLLADISDGAVFKSVDALESAAVSHASNLIQRFSGPQTKQVVQNFLVNSQQKSKALKSLSGPALNNILAFVDDVVSKGTHAKAAKLSQYKKAYLAGKQPAPAAKKAFDALSSDEKEVMLLKWGKAKEVTQTVARKSATQQNTLLLDDFSRTGPQRGSNPGGLFSNKSNGETWYFKFPDNVEMARNEILAARLYQAAGVEVPELRFVTGVFNGKQQTGIASRIIDDLKPGKAKLTAGRTLGAQDNFVVDAWLGNWDVVGLDYDNLLLKAGKAIRVDTGGALRFRAQGGAKGAAFGKKVEELDSLRNSATNSQAASVFKHVSDEDLKAGARKVAAITDEAIDELVDQFGPTGKAEATELKAILKARRDDIASRYKVTAAPPPAPTPPAGYLAPQEWVEVERSRSVGKALLRDGLDVEDLNVRAYVETGLDGNRTTVLSFKLRPDAMERVEAKLASRVKGGAKAENSLQLQTRQMALEQANKLADEAQSAYNTILKKVEDLTDPGMAGKVAQQKKLIKDLQDRVTALEAEKAELLTAIQRLQGSSVSGLTQYATNLQRVITQSDAALVRLQDILPRYDATNPNGFAWLQARLRDRLAAGGRIIEISGTDRKNMLAKVQAAIREAEERAKGVVKAPSDPITSVTRSKEARQQIVEFTDGHAVVKSVSESTVGQHDRLVVLLDDGTEITLWGRESSTAIRGQVVVKTSGGSVATLEQSLRALEKLGVDMARATDTDVEMLFLRRLIWAREKDAASLFQQVDGLAPNAQLPKLREMYKKLTGLDPETSNAYRAQWRGQHQAFEGGARVWYRPDFVEDPGWNKFRKEYVLAHSITSGDAPGALERVLSSGGMFTPTIDKIRRGIPVRGMSPDSDMNTGGASYFFTRLAKRRNHAGSQPGHFYWKGDVAARSDAIGYAHDEYGAVSANVLAKRRNFTLSEYVKVASSSGNETNFKGGLSVFENFDRAVFYSRDRRKVQETLRRHKIKDTWPDGRPIDEAIQFDDGLPVWGP